MCNVSVCSMRGFNNMQSTFLFRRCRRVIPTPNLLGDLLYFTEFKNMFVTEEFIVKTVFEKLRCLGVFKNKNV